MADFTILNTQDDFHRALELSESEPVVVFKHSNMCSLSARAHNKLSTLVQETDPKVFQITVQDARPLSDHLEELLDIRHESPQIIILRNGKPIFNTSHQRVTAENVRDNLNNEWNP